MFQLYYSNKYKWESFKRKRAYYALNTSRTLNRINHLNTMYKLCALCLNVVRMVNRILRKSICTNSNVNEIILFNNIRVTALLFITRYLSTYITLANDKSGLIETDETDST